MMSDLSVCSKCGASLPDPDPSRAGMCVDCRSGGEPKVGNVSNTTNGDSDSTLSLGVDGSGVGILETIAESLGTLPLSVLRDTQLGDEPGPSIRPIGDTLADRTIRYRIDGEIARGGMGAVFKGRDPDLGRDVAIKVLREDHGRKPEMVLRFVEEAQIGGQLQHPGIVPIYELGTLADLRPFFSMKLVKGQTLAALLNGRKKPGDDLSRFLTIFEQVAQTVAYAHARGVIHRDLKPSNVMVGAFGEVQVMDWGLAKILTRGELAEERQVKDLDDPDSVIATARSLSDDPSLSRAGSALGTPSYMAPEQARGEINLTDERADVFALGSILCEILTGQPVFVGKSVVAILKQAEQGDVLDAATRLDASGFDPDLITLTKSCLAPDPAGRPRAANAVANAIVAYRRGVEDRLRSAEIAQAKASARAAEERKRRQWQGGLAASLLALSMLGGLSFTYWLQTSQARTAREDKRLSEATFLRDRARERPEEVVPWEKAVAAARAVGDDLEIEGGKPERARVSMLLTEVEQGLSAARRDANLRQELISIRANVKDAGAVATDDAYGDAFEAAGINFDLLSPDQAAALLLRRSNSVVIELASFIDHWSAMRRLAGRPLDSWRTLLDVSLAVDSDSLRSQVRTLLRDDDRKAHLAELISLADDSAVNGLPAPTAILLADALGEAGQPERQVALLRKTVIIHPDDVWVNFGLAQALQRLRPVPREEVIRYYTVARALQPDTAHELAHALELIGRGDEAEAVFGDLVARRPTNARDLSCYGVLLSMRGKSNQANLILERAVEAGREAVRQNPEIAVLHSNLGNALKSLGKLDEAIAAASEAIRLKPDEAEAYGHLGSALELQGKPDEALAVYREGIRLNPGDPRVRDFLGMLLAQNGKHQDAIVCFSDAIRLDPIDANAYYNLAGSLRSLAKLDESLAAYREAIRLKPDFALAHHHLGTLLESQGKHDEASASFREAIRLKPGFAESHCLLGQSLQRQGKLREALEALRKGHELGSQRPGWTYPSAGWVEECQRQLEASERIALVLSEKAPPRDASEFRALAKMLRDQGRHAAATRIWAQAFQLDPNLVDSSNGDLYRASCSAALAGSGKAKDDPAPNDQEKARLRRQALDWLKLELSGRAKALETGSPKNRKASADRLRQWRQDPDLASLRDPAALKLLPEAERLEWSAFWAEVDRLVQRTSDTAPKTP